MLAAFRLIAAASLAVAFFTYAALAETLVYQATTSGQQAIDRDIKGGNPFASALIDTLTQPDVALPDLAQSLRRLTLHYSRDRQTPELPQSAPSSTWHVSPAMPGEKRIALVLVVSDYSRAGAQNLPGALFDAERVAAALTRAGFVTETAVDLDRAAAAAKLAAFAEASKSSDAAVIYTTGHGVEVDGTVYLLPGDYPIEEGNKALAKRGIPLPIIALAAMARTINLVFYGGCRDNPLAE